MKRFIAVIIVIVSLLALSSCSSTDWSNAKHIEYTCPDSMRLLTTETVDSCADILDYLGADREEVLKSMSQNTMLFSSFLPHYEEGSDTPAFPTEMFMTVTSSDYVTNIFNFNRLSKEELDAVVEENRDVSSAQENGYVFTEDMTTLENNGAFYLKYVYTIEAKQGKNDTEAKTQYVTQYTTIYNGFAYSFYCATPLEDRTQVDAARDEFFSSIRFTQTLEASEPYDPDFALLTHSIGRFFKNSWLEVLIIAVLTVGITVFILIYNDRKKKNPKKKDHIVRADYLK